MRVTEQSKYLVLKRQVQNRSAEAQRAAEQLATGERLRARDEDMPASQTLDRLRRVTSKWRGYEQAGIALREQVTVADSVLGDATNVLTEAREVAVMLGSGPRTQGQLDAGAQKIDQLFQTLRSVANTRVADEYLFAGTATDTEPFDATGQYQGSAQLRSVEIQPGEELSQADGALAFGSSAGVDAFGALTNLANALRAGNQTAALAAGDDLKEAMQQVVAERQRMGTHINALDQADAFREQMLIQFQDRASEAGDTDIAEAASRLQLAQTALQATVEVSGRLKSIDVLGRL